MRVVRQLTYVGDRDVILRGLRRRGVKVSRQASDREIIYERILEVSETGDVNDPAPTLSDDELRRVREIEEP